MIRVPFDVELAKNITNGKVDGRIVTREGKSVRIVCWNKIDKTYPIVGLEDNGFEEYLKSYTTEGIWDTDSCKNQSLMLEIPEYMTFKDGNVIAFGHTEKSLAIGIFHRQISYKSHECYVKLDWSGGLVYDVEPLTYNNARYATEEEKQRLIKSLKESKDIEAKECLKKLGIEQKKEYEFKPFDKVLVRNDTKDIWVAEIFSNYKYKDSEHTYTTLGGVSWKYCVPYNENTKYLLGTFKYWEETR